MKEPTYEDLLKSAQANPETADFTALRMAYTRSAQYDPYLLRCREKWDKIHQRLQEAMRAARWEEAVALGEEILTLDSLDTETHMAKAFCHAKLKQADKERFHRAFAQGMINSITGAGDGAGYDTALRVISTREEYVILGVLGVKSEMQELHEHDGHRFDILRFRDPRTGEQRPLFFDIDLLWSRMKSQMMNRSGDSASQKASEDESSPAATETSGTPQRRKRWQFWK